MLLFYSKPLKDRHSFFARYNLAIVLILLYQNLNFEFSSAFDELLTACFVAPEKFSLRVANVISNLQRKAGTEFRWKQLQDLLHEQQPAAVGGVAGPRKR